MCIWSTFQFESSTLERHTTTMGQFGRPLSLALRTRDWNDPASSRAELLINETMS